MNPSTEEDAIDLFAKLLSETSNPRAPMPSADGTPHDPLGWGRATGDGKSRRDPLGPLDESERDAIDRVATGPRDPKSARAMSLVVLGFFVYQYMASPIIFAPSGVVRARVKVFKATELITAKDRKSLRLVKSGFKFVEGPVYVRQGDYWLFSDVKANKVYRWSEHSDLSVYRNNSSHANGHTIDAAGRLLYTCEHAGRRVAVTELHSGTVSTFVDSHQDRPLTSPNDITVRQKDGSVWFSDPDYGCQPHLGHGNPRQQEGNYVYRVAAEGGPVAVMIADMVRPNGLVFSPDERRLFVADSGAGFGADYDPSRPHHVMVYDVSGEGIQTTLARGRVFVKIETSARYPDGLAMDTSGHLFVACAEGVLVYSPAAELVAKVLTPKPAANMAFGGSTGGRLLITATDTIWIVNFTTVGTSAVTHLALARLQHEAESRKVAALARIDSALQELSRKKHAAVEIEDFAEASSIKAEMEQLSHRRSEVIREAGPSYSVSATARVSPTGTNVDAPGKGSETSDASGGEHPEL